MTSAGQLIAAASSHVSVTNERPEDADMNVSDDEIFSELEKEIDDDFDMSAFRERRLEELKREMNTVKDMREQEHGRLVEITDEKEAIRTTSTEKQCVVHFYHRNFKRCEIMNKHLEILAKKYFATRFLKVFVENIPWLVERLNIKVLPCVICFIDGVAKDRLVGFEEIGNSDGFETASLELRLQMIGVIEKPKPASVPVLKTLYSSTSSKIRGTVGGNIDSDSDE